MSDHYVTSVPARVPGYDWYDFTITPLSSFDDTSYIAINVPACHGVSTDTATVSVVKARASVPTFGGPQQSLVCPTVQPPTAVSTSMLSSRNLFPVPTQHSTPGLAAPVASTEIEGSMANLTLSNVSPGLVQPQVVPLVPGSVLPTAAVSGQMPASMNSAVPTPLVGTTAVIAPPSVAIVPPPLVAALPSTGTISVLPSVDIVTPSSSVAPSAAPSSSIASSLPVGTGISLSSTSSSQPSYQPMVVVNTPRLVRPYNGSTSWTSFRDHFKRVAKVNRWEDNVTQAQHLMLALEVNAAEVLKEISDTSPTVLQDI